MYLAIQYLLFKNRRKFSKRGIEREEVRARRDKIDWLNKIQLEKREKEVLMCLVKGKKKADHF